MNHFAPSLLLSVPPDVAGFVSDFDAALAKSASNVSALYQLDGFDWIVLTLYFTLLGILALYGAFRISQVVNFWRYRNLAPQPARLFDEDELPFVTVQLPLFNEMYVVERLLAAVTELDYPRTRFEIQVLDDSTDETRGIARRAVERYAAEGFDISYIHRTDRTGFKAGALANGHTAGERRTARDIRRRLRAESRFFTKARTPLHRFARGVRASSLVAHQRLLQSADALANHHARRSFRHRADGQESHRRLLQLQRNRRAVAARGD
jgi:hypothetical protein